MRFPAWIGSLVLVVASSAHADAKSITAINAVTGDASWVDSPEAWRAPETIRVQTHLAWIEARLRQATTANLSRAQRVQRARLLDVLAKYREAGVFPQHRAGAVTSTHTRRPRFIDDRGRACAVAHLIEVSGNSALAHFINASHEYDYVLDMHEPELDAWATAHGFSAIELAMIQPTYDNGGSVEDPRDREREHEMQTRVLRSQLRDSARFGVQPTTLTQCFGARRGTWSVRIDIEMPRGRSRNPTVIAVISTPIPEVKACIERNVAAEFQRRSRNHVALATIHERVSTQVTMPIPVATPARPRTPPPSKGKR